MEKESLGGRETVSVCEAGREREWQTAAPGIECVCDVRVFERESARVRSRDTCV